MKNLNSLYSVRGRKDQGVYLAWETALAGNRALCFWAAKTIRCADGSCSSSASSMALAGKAIEELRFPANGMYFQTPFLGVASGNTSMPCCDMRRELPFSIGASSPPKLLVSRFVVPSVSSRSASMSSSSSRGRRLPPKRRLRIGIWPP